MSNTVKITEEEFDKKVRRALTKAFADQLEDDDEHPEYESAASYGAGVEETPKPIQFEDRAEATAAAKHAYKQLQEQQSEDAAAYTSGVEGSVRSGTGEQKDTGELAAEAADHSDPLVDSDDGESDEVYATGVEGSTSHQKELEQKAEERQAELIADAMRDVLEEMSEEE